MKKYRMHQANNRWTACVFHTNPDNLAKKGESGRSHLYCVSPAVCAARLLRSFSS